jgi:hypothetical protein
MQKLCCLIPRRRNKYVQQYADYYATHYVSEHFQISILRHLSTVQILFSTLVFKHILCAKFQVLPAETVDNVAFLDLMTCLSEKILTFR